MSTSNDPLWLKVNDAFWPYMTARKSAAAVLRVIADEVVPEEPPPHRGMRPGGSTLTYQETLSVERQRIRQHLLAEAKRAEAGR